jgi:hypothetical protein
LDPLDRDEGGYAHMAGNSRQKCYGNVQNPLELETPKPGVLLGKPRSRATSGSTEKCPGRFSALSQNLQFGGPLSSQQHGGVTPRGRGCKVTPLHPPALGYVDGLTASNTRYSTIHKLPSRVGVTHCHYNLMRTALQLYSVFKNNAFAIILSQVTSSLHSPLSFAS